MMEKLSQVHSLLAQRQSAVNNTFKVLIYAFCSLLGVVMSSVSYADGYRQVCTAPTTVCVLSGSVNSCTETTHCDWVLDGSPPSGWTPPPPTPNPNTGGSVGTPPPVVNCDLKKAESNQKTTACDLATSKFKSERNSQCNSVPAVVSRPITAELAVTLGMDAKLLNGSIVLNVGGTWIQEFHPKEGCMTGAADAVAIKEASCKDELASRDMARVNAGCPL